MINDLVISQIRQRLEILYQMVDELETSGGGGGGQGGVTDYNDLTSKPKIGGVTLQGDKTAASLGLATSTALNTLSTTVNTLSGTVADLFVSDPVTISSGGTLPAATQTRVANHEPIYFNNGEYSGQYYFIEDEGSVFTIYATVPTSGALPTITYARIERSTNKVEFYQTAVDITPTSNSQDLITSGGVYTALQSKLNISDIDTALSSTSTNPVQNKVINTALAAKANASALTEETTARENADTALQTSITNMQPFLSGKKVYEHYFGSTSGSDTYTVNKSDFGTGNLTSCGIYLIYRIGWGYTPSISIYALAYTGNRTEYTSLQKIFGDDFDITVAQDVLSFTTAGKIQIIAVN